MKNWTGIDWINHGSRLSEQDPWLAQKIISKGIKEAANEPDAYFNLGIALHMQKRPDAAIRAYQTSLSMEGCPLEKAKRNLAQDLLLNGNFKEGWETYEIRFKPLQNKYFEDVLGQAWAGPRSGKKLPDHIVLVGEQGFGDTFQFSRFALIMQKLKVRTSLFCQSELLPLLKEGTEIEHVTNYFEEGELNTNSTWCPLLSMPGRLQANKKHLPSISFPYIYANPNKIKEWGQKLHRSPNHKLIGIHWQGNPKFEIALYSKGRSMKFEDWLHLKGIPGIEFISLQKGAAKEQLKIDQGLNFVKGQELFSKSMDFRDTAAVISHCDLVISADSGIIHLSGAMGIPTWVALPWVSEWRWGLNEPTTNWYPSMRLFRQEKLGGWENPVAKIRKEMITHFIKDS